MLVKQGIAVIGGASGMELVSRAKDCIRRLGE